MIHSTPQAASGHQPASPCSPVVQLRPALHKSGVQHLLGLGAVWQRAQCLDGCLMRWIALAAFHHRAAQLAPPPRLRIGAQLPPNTPAAGLLPKRVVPAKALTSLLLGSPRKSLYSWSTAGFSWARRITARSSALQAVGERVQVEGGVGGSPLSWTGSTSIPQGRVGGKQ